jgi:glutamate 5-kinase
MKRNEYLKGMHRIVVKVGTSSITKGGPGASSEFMDSVAKQIKALRDKGIDVLIVTSGAIGIGLSTMNARPRSREIPIRQAAASIGQSVLMQKWNDSFQKYGIAVAQILLTYDFYSDREKYLNLRNAIQTLLEYRVVPIFNENDAVCVKEIDATFGDNDTLSAMVSIKMDADLLIILSDVDGLYDRDPKISKDAKLITDVNADVLNGIPSEMTVADVTGGVRGKMGSMLDMCGDGRDCILVNGTVHERLYSLLIGKDVVCTRARK